MKSLLKNSFFVPVVLISFALAACIGHSFDAKTLSMISGREPAEVTA